MAPPFFMGPSILFLFRKSLSTTWLQVSHRSEVPLSLAAYLYMPQDTVRCFWARYVFLHGLLHKWMPKQIEAKMNENGKFPNVEADNLHLPYE